ncbi:MAG: discoidin domain-containing protein [Verrucomicrobia bacterium]|nr:discoidin domain-containing protein [Verrucomicrobiota bacterium]
MKTVLAVKVRDTHIAFEAVAVEPREKVELVIWGPYPTTINRTIGELVGVVRDEVYGIGIQVLNPKTMGGYPKNSNDGMPIWHAPDPNHYKESWLKTGAKQRFWSETAKHTDFGSILQAYCRDRSQEREIGGRFGSKRQIAPAYNDGGVVGSAIALFGCPEPEILATLESIELVENLPHPTTADGKWAKTAKTAGPAIILVGFSEENIGHVIDLAKRAGITRIYSRSAFKTWGHWQLKPEQFPNGRAGLKRCVELAAKEGIEIGLHYLCFISVSKTHHYACDTDPYVSSGDARLATLGRSTLREAVDAAASTIPIAEPDYFRKQTRMNTVRMGSELIHYQSVSDEAPWTLQGCRRGAWGSKAAAHAQGAEVAKLLDHSWNCFLPNPELAVEMARNMAELCNETGITQVGHDGLEGMACTGLGQYGRAAYITAWYDSLKPALKGRIWNEASNAAPFNWHANTHFSWGECEGYSRSSSMSQYRASQQAFFVRNYLPRHLGFYVTKSRDTAADAEFMLAQSAGFDAGFCIELGNYTHGNNLDLLLDTVGIWQAARRADAFPETLKPLLQDPANSFHLEADGDGQWKLYPVLSGARGEPLTLPNAHPLDEEVLHRFDRLKALEALVGGRVTSSRPHETGFPPELAFDGVRTLESSWRTAPYPAALTIEQDKTRELKAIHVYPYWGRNRYYQYTVEVSADGRTWQRVGDMSKNTTPSTSKGDRFEFEPMEVRHIRVNMLHHSLNPGVHIVEIEAE